MGCAACGGSRSPLGQISISTEQKSTSTTGTEKATKKEFLIAAIFLSTLYNV
jgi:hypothetical protein